MKKLSLGLASATLATVLVACGSNEEGNTNTVTNEASTENNVVENETLAEEENEPNEDLAETDNENNEELEANEDPIEEIADGDWEHQVGDTVENEAGQFTLVKRNDQIETIENGPFVLNMPQINVTSGVINEDYQFMFDEQEEVNYIQIDMEVENTSDEDAIFYVSQATISTNTGEQLESDMWMSDHIDGEMMAGTRHEGSFFFIMNNSQAEDVETIRVTMSAPIDSDWNEIGEEVDFEISFN